MLFDNLLNMIKINFKLYPKGPMLIKSGTDSFLEPALSDMTFVRAITPWGETIYIPGSSLKGVIRSYSELYAKSIGKEICNPLGASSCGKKIESEDGEERYKKSCLACRTFGSTLLSSKVSISDAFPFTHDDPDDKKREKIEDVSKHTFIKYGVAIDRENASVGFGPFDMEVLYGGEFFGEIVITNAELWQLGLVLSALYDINAGYVQIGFAKSRGLGRVGIDVLNTEFTVVKKKGESGILFAKGVKDIERYEIRGDEFERVGEDALFNVWRYSGDILIPKKEKLFYQARKSLLEVK